MALRNVTVPDAVRRRSVWDAAARESRREQTEVLTRFTKPGLAETFKFSRGELVRYVRDASMRLGHGERG